MQHVNFHIEPLRIGNLFQGLSLLNTHLLQAFSAASVHLRRKVLFLRPETQVFSPASTHFQKITTLHSLICHRSMNHCLFV